MVGYCAKGGRDSEAPAAFEGWWELTLAKDNYSQDEMCNDCTPELMSVNEKEKEEGSSDTPSDLLLASSPVSAMKPDLGSNQPVYRKQFCR